MLAALADQTNIGTQSNYFPIIAATGVFFP
jgi:hypothetical protein